MKRISEKAWITLIMAFTFVIVTISGIMMTVHIKNGALVHIHQWFGLIFLLLGIIHLMLNWKVFSSYINRQKVAVSIAVFVILVLFLIVGDSVLTGGHSFGISKHGYFNSKVHGRQGSCTYNWFE